MLRVELTTQIARLRTLVAVICLAAIPVLAGFTTASHAGHRNGRNSGLFGAATYSALNHTAASLQFIAPLLLPLVVTLLATAIGSADRDWGILRYLYIQPVSRTRLLTGKLAAVTIATITATAAVLVAGLLSGIALFGWHSFHILDAPALSTGDAAARLLAATGYTILCMLSIAAIAFALGIALPRGAEALGIAIAFVILASILDGQPHLHGVAVILPTHYWQNWTHLLDGTRSNLVNGIIDQLATIAVATAAAVLVLRRRDPAA